MRCYVYTHTIPHISKVRGGPPPSPPSPPACLGRGSSVALQIVPQPLHQFLPGELPPFFRRLCSDGSNPSIHVVKGTEGQPWATTDDMLGLAFCPVGSCLPCFPVLHFKLAKVVQVDLFAFSGQLDDQIDDRLEHVVDMRLRYTFAHPLRHRLTERLLRDRIGHTAIVTPIKPGKRVTPSSGVAAADYDTPVPHRLSRSGSRPSTGENGLC